MRIIEKTSIILFILGLVLKKFGVPGNNIILTLSALVCASIYFFLGFAFFNGIRLRNIFRRSGYIGIATGKILYGILAGYVFFSVVAGVLFKVENWPGSKMMISSAFVLGAALMIFSLVSYVNRKSLSNYIILTRAIPFLFIVICLYAIPNDTLYRLLR